METGVGRRAFMASSLAIVGASALARAAGEAAPTSGRAAYAMHIYSFKNADMAKRADDYFQNALIPALHRAGTGPVGVLIESGKKDNPGTYYVLVPVSSIAVAGELPRTLDADAEYLKTGEAFLKAPPNDPGFTNLEVRIMLAPDWFPKIEVPEKKPTRLFELRRYRNPSEKALRSKLEMFGTGSEVAIFRRVGLNPVFFSEMLAGPDMPNVTYMLTYPDAAAKGKAWGAFGGDAEWQKLKSTPGYTDPEIIANIKSTMLKPAEYSEI
jgi:NIPSNAP